MCTLHGLNWKHPETHNSSGNQDVRQLPLGQGLGGQRIELHPHYPLVWMKRFMSWNEKLKPPQLGSIVNDVVCFASHNPGNHTWNCPLKQRGNRALGLPRARQFYCNTWLEMLALITYVPWLLQILFIRAEALFTNWTLAHYNYSFIMENAPHVFLLQNHK